MRKTIPEVVEITCDLCGERMSGSTGVIVLESGTDEIKGDCCNGCFSLAKTKSLHDLIEYIKT